MSKENERQAFMEYLREDPLDISTRKIFSDWLDENDEPEFANFQRNFTVKDYGNAKAYLEMFASECGVDLYHMVEAANRYLTEGEWLCIGDDTPDICYSGMKEFWKSYGIYTNILLPKDKSEDEFVEYEERFVRCAC
jgi:uncharacterized protein (TIGR02996 family)